jgi:VanZ family protein
VCHCWLVQQCAPPTDIDRADETGSRMWEANPFADGAAYLSIPVTQSPNPRGPARVHQALPNRVHARFQPSIREIRVGRLLAVFFRWATIALVLYWLALFVLTHIPLDKIEAREPFHNFDKVVHFTAYAGLACIAAAAWTWRRRLVARDFLILLACVSAYGVADELLQSIPALHRTCDFWDWVADTTGAAVGLLLFAAAARAARRRGMKLARRRLLAREGL